MALYAIGDTHLSLGSNKPMDVFGGAWKGYVEKLRAGLSVIGPEDTTVLLGDLSWALDLTGAKADFAWINRIPGKKILLKGNHDYWWCTAAKFRKFCEENGFRDMQQLNNNCFCYNGIALCGTRGWFYELDNQGTHNEKVLLREIGRLETSLKAAGDHEKLCFLHYPPLYQGYQCPEILRLLREYEVKVCCYGHLHGPSHRRALQGERGGTLFFMVSGDYLGFHPKKICD